MKKLFISLVRLFAATAVSTNLSAGIAAHYHLLAPGWQVCLQALLLLEIAGGMLRGQLPYLFTEDAK